MKFIVALQNINLKNKGEKMPNYYDFCKKLGPNYSEFFDSLFTNKEDKEKFMNKTFMNDEIYIQVANEIMLYEFLAHKIDSNSSNPYSDYKKISHSQKYDIEFETKDYKLFIEMKSVLNYSRIKAFENTSNKHKKHSNVKSVNTNKSKSSEKNEKISTKGLYEQKQSEFKNRIIPYLDFPNKVSSKDSDSNINILFISSDTLNFVKNVDSLINGYAGIYTKNKAIDLERYNVDFVILSNCSEAHLIKNLYFNLFSGVWDFENYINFVIPLKVDNNDDKLIKKNNFVSKLFDDKLMDFYNERKTKYNDSAYDILILQLLNFIKIEYPMFDIEKKNN